MPAGSSADDQSSVAGHIDSERDQTVSSPLHLAAHPQRSPTPDPVATHQCPSSASKRPAPARVEVPFFSAKAAVQRQASEASMAAAAAAAATADASGKLVQSEILLPEGDSDLPAAAAIKQNSQHLSSAAAGSSSRVEGSFPQGQGGLKGLALLGLGPSTAPASPGVPVGKLQKPTRCQKCHTCRHKQLKKQCLRNKVTTVTHM